MRKDLFSDPRGKKSNLPPSSPVPNPILAVHSALQAQHSVSGCFLSFRKSLLAQARTVVKNMVKINQNGQSWVLLNLLELVNTPELTNALLTEVVRSLYQRITGRTWLPVLHFVCLFVCFWQLWGVLELQRDSQSLRLVLRQICPFH